MLRTVQTSSRSSVRGFRRPGTGRTATADHDEQARARSQDFREVVVADHGTAADEHDRRANARDRPITARRSSKRGELLSRAAILPIGRTRSARQYRAFGEPCL